MTRILAKVCAYGSGLSALAVSTMMVVPLAAVADSYPVKPIKLIVPFPAGGPTDLSARLLAQLLSPRLAQQIVIDNRPGASGAIGAKVAAMAAPDGYTLLFCNSPTHSVNPAIIPNLGYDPDEDFTPIVRFGTVPLILTVGSHLPVRSIADLVGRAKTEPSRVRYGSAGVASFTHIAGELLAQQTNIKLLHVPYKGLAPAITDAIGGHIDMVFVTPLEGLPHISAGRLRALAVTSARRLVTLPEVPTMAESGVMDGELLTWGGLCGPHGVSLGDSQEAERGCLGRLPFPKREGRSRAPGLRGSG